MRTEKEGVMPDVAKMPTGEKAIILNPSEEFKLAQAMYYILTGKTEKINNTYHGNYKIEMPAIRQLYTKLEQMTTQWEILGKNCNITVFHANDNFQMFSSLERFELYDTSITSPIESLTFNFNFLLKLPEARCDERYSAQNYNITIRFLSKVVMYNEKPSGMPVSLLKLFGDSTIVSEIEYVDYNIARSIVATIDSWAKEVEQSKKSKALAFIQDHSRWMTRLTKLSAFCFAVAAMLINTSKYSNSYTFELLAKYMLISIGTIYLLTKLGEYFGRFSATEIDALTEISYININIGDKRSIEKFNRRNSLSIVKAIGGILLAILQVALTDSISNYMVSIIGNK